MSTFNSLSVATRLVDAGVPRDQAEVHAQVLQSVYDEEHDKYATKADFLQLSHDVKLQINHLESNSDRIEAKTDQLEATVSQIGAKVLQVESKVLQVESKVMQVECKVMQVDEKVNQVAARLIRFENHMSAELAEVKTTVSQCKDEFVGYQADVSDLKISNKYMLWINGFVATICLSVIAVCVPMFLHSLK